MTDNFSRLERAVLEARVLDIDRSLAVEALELADRDETSGSIPAARLAAARVVAGRHKTMPGPLLLAMAEIEREQR